MEQSLISAEFITKNLGKIPDLAIILGTGLGNLVERLTDKTEIPYANIPHFPMPTVSSHAGKLVKGSLDGRDILVFSGRFHFYEGYSMRETAYPVAVSKALGVKTMILTNAAGGLDEEMTPGDFMLIKDHIKLCAESPLRCENGSNGTPRFADMTSAYDKALIDTARRTADDLGLKIFEGVYAFMSGPQFETPAEIKMLKVLGASAVGMSTVAEAIAAADEGIRILAISLITNMAAGILDEPVSDDEVILTAKQSAGDFAALIAGIAGKI